MYREHPMIIPDEPLWSSLSNIANHGPDLPGAAMKTLLMTTMEIPCLAAILDSPTFSPSAVVSIMPLQKIIVIKSATSQ